MKGLRISASRFASLIPVGLVLAALVSGALADAQSQPPDQRPHLLLVPDSAEAEVTLERTDARVIARYESFSLVEAAGADDARLRAAGADRRDDMRTVTTAAGELDPKTARRSLAGKEAPERDEVLALVQFVGPPKDSWLERLRATGARIVTYQAENAYVVHAGGDEVERLAALLGGYAPVRAVSVLTAADKLESSHSPSGRYAVQTVTGAEGADARAEASAAGAGVSPSATVGALRTQYLELTDAEAAELARDPAVVAVEPYGEPELADERAAQIVAGNLTAGFGPSGPGYLDWLVHPDRIPDEGTFDFAIDVSDEGLDSGVDPPQHADFRAQGSGASRIAYLNNYSSDGTAADCGGHGTNVASIATGYNQGSGSPGFEDAPSGYNHGLGVAPFARLGASKIFTCGGGFAGGWTPATLASNAYAGSARVTNNSWGTSGVSSWGAYNSRAQQYDAVVRDARAADSGNQEMVEVFAAGNDGDDGVPGETIPNYNEGYGTILAEATAKNVITVGASEGVRASGPDGCGTPDSGADSSRDIVDFSSRGPTDDGRLKPDLVAPGTHVTGARPQHAGYTGYRACTNPFGGPLYTLISGSSQAAPQVSGAAALVRHWYERTRGAEPSPALIKAFLINTATDLAGGQSGTGGTVAAGPNADQGWGRVNLGKAFDSTAREFRDQLPGDVLGASGDTLARSYAVQDTGSPVKVTLAWTDSPGPTIGNAYVNDLDLQVEAGGRTYNGNVFAGAFSRSGGSADTRNNVESVHLPAGTTGPFAVRVVGSNIPGDGVPGNADATDQDFALVVSNADEQASPVLVHDATALDDSLTAGGDGDDALEPGESFELDERLRNAGSADATGVSGVLTGGSDVTITQSTSAWPDLAPGGTAENTTAFEGTVPADTTCGTEVQAGLVLTTAQGPHNVPLTLPTGTEGPLESRTQSHTPGLDIPDDDAVGVTSPITVASAGRIKDLDVRIGDLEHDFVGDLRIDLTGPDGTTVTLAAHPGGPDNPGKDFTNTIFDDEAATSISAGTDPYTGRFRPQNDQLARFDGKQQQGTWTLRVRDLFEGDTGVLRGWGTDTRPAACSVSVAPPQTTIGAGPVEGATVSNPTAIFTFSSSAAGATFECEIDGGNWSSCSSPQTYNGLQDGTHTFRVRAVSLGQTDPTPAKRTWTINTLPDTVIASGPSEMSRVSSTSASFQFESPDTPGATFECSLDGAAFAPCTDPSGLPDGNHTIAARARNAAGKVDASPAIRNWTVDTVGPISSVSGPTGSIVDSEPTLTGRGGTLAGDAGTVTVRVYPGGGHPDPPVAAPSHTLTAPVAPGSGQWSVDLPSPVSGLGPHTVQVEQVDVAGNTRRSARSVFNVVTDAVAPTLTLTAPTSGSTTTNRTPTLAGVAGTAPGDDGTVAVKLWSGTLAAGLPTQTLFVPRDATTGAFSAQPSALPDGSYTVRAEQGDAALPTENVGVSNAAVFGLITAVDPPRPADPTAPATPAPSVVAAPVEERLSDALAGRYTVSAACASACRVSAGLSLASSAARRLGLSARSRAIGGGSKRLTRAGSASMRLKLTRAARSALGGRSRASATLSVTVTAGADTFALTRKITLSRSAGLRTVVRRGLGLWAVCSRRCPLSGELTVSSTEARRLGLKPGRSARMGIASGHVRATAQPARVTLRLGGKVKKAVARARRLHARLELAGGSAPDNDRTAARTLTLRR